MFNKYFDSGFNRHQYIVSNKHMIVVANDAIFSFLNGSEYSDNCTYNRPIWPINIFKHIDIVDLVI